MASRFARSTLEVPEMRRIKKIHFVGIGGAGMCGIAEVLLIQGYQISGSDKQESKITGRLQELGATIHIGHTGANVEFADVVVVSHAAAGRGCAAYCRRPGFDAGRPGTGETARDPAELHAASL